MRGRDARKGSDGWLVSTCSCFFPWPACSAPLAELATPVFVSQVWKVFHWSVWAWTMRAEGTEIKFSVVSGWGHSLLGKEKS